MREFSLIYYDVPDRFLFSVFKAGDTQSALNAIFEGYVSGTNQTARWTLFSGIVDSISFDQSDGALFNSTLTYQAYIWSATGG